MTAIHAYLVKTSPLALNCDDILRSSLVLAVSSFDLFMHDVYRLEALQRLAGQRDIPLLKIPFNILHIEATQRCGFLEDFIKKENAHKSFVAPDKVAECLRSLIDAPWDGIAAKFGSSSSSCKAQLKGVVDLRNRIAHEADVNPTFGGTELWPIYAEDVSDSVNFLRRLGRAIAEAL